MDPEFKTQSPEETRTQMRALFDAANVKAEHDRQTSLEDKANKSIVFDERWPKHDAAAKNTGDPDNNNSPS